MKLLNLNRLKLLSRYIQSGLMAIQNGNFGFTGSIGNISGYRMRGHDKAIVRTKGGASKRQIKTAPVFEATRQLNNEWKAVTRAAAGIRAGMEALRPLADYNISGPLNALVKKIQTADTVNPKGKRSILFSLQRDFLGSFSYNRQTLFDSVIRQSLTVNIDSTAAVAEATIPALLSAVNFFPHPRYAYYRIVLAFIAVSDYHFNERTGNYNARARSRWFNITRAVCGRRTEIEGCVNGRIPKFLISFQKLTFFL